MFPPPKAKSLIPKDTPHKVLSLLTSKQSLWLLIDCNSKQPREQPTQRAHPYPIIWPKPNFPLIPHHEAHPLVQSFPPHIRHIANRSNSFPNIRSTRSGPKRRPLAPICPHHILKQSAYAKEHPFLLQTSTTILPTKPNFYFPNWDIVWKCERVSKLNTYQSCTQFSKAFFFCTYQSCY